MHDLHHYTRVDGMETDLFRESSGLRLNTPGHKGSTPTGHSQTKCVLN